MKMVELSVATREQIQDELKRREISDKDKKIKDFLNEINYAYNAGRITGIYRDVENQGTSVSVTKYHVFTK
jgi:hypothetical protein